MHGELDDTPLLRPVHLQVDLQLLLKVHVGSCGRLHVDDGIVLLSVRGLQPFNLLDQPRGPVQEVGLAAEDGGLLGLRDSQVEHAIGTPRLPAGIGRLVEGAYEGAVVYAVSERLHPQRLDGALVDQVYGAEDVVLEGSQVVALHQVGAEEQSLRPVDEVGPSAVWPDSELSLAVPLYVLAYLGDVLAACIDDALVAIIQGVVDLNVDVLGGKLPPQVKGFQEAVGVVPGQLDGRLTDVQLSSSDGDDPSQGHTEQVAVLGLVNGSLQGTKFQESIIIIWTKV